jgi:hypothetical protein
MYIAKREEATGDEKLHVLYSFPDIIEIIK